VIATLQLVNEICEVALFMSDEDVSKLGWPDFMDRITPDKYPELITYLKERRLYLNEPVPESIGEE
jgi:peptide methionine sulfoxide reductase MsrB